MIWFQFFFVKFLATFNSDNLNIVLESFRKHAEFKK